MPNRVIKDSLLSSDKISTLTDAEFRLWISLILMADDAGRGDARPAIIKGHAFPLRERVAQKDIDASLHGLAAKGCVSLYTVGGKPYFWFPTWKEHQRIRDVKPKYPAPEDADDTSRQSAAGCGELPQVAAGCGQNPIQSESNPNTNPNTNPRGADAFAAFAAGDAALMESLSAFEEMRQKIKKPLTARAKAGICANLTKLAGEDRNLMVQILDQSTLHCWQDVFALKGQKGQDFGQYQSHDSVSSLGQRAIQRLLKDTETGENHGK